MLCQILKYGVVFLSPLPSASSVSHSVQESHGHAILYLFLFNGEGCSYYTLTINKGPLTPDKPYQNVLFDTATHHLGTAKIEPCGYRRMDDILSLARSRSAVMSMRTYGRIKIVPFAPLLPLTNKQVGGQSCNNNLTSCAQLKFSMFLFRKVRSSALHERLAGRSSAIDFEHNFSTKKDSQREFVFRCGFSHSPLCKVIQHMHVLLRAPAFHAWSMHKIF